jgi:hypothetical protein
MSQRTSLASSPERAGRSHARPVIAGAVAGCVLAGVVAIGTTAVAQRTPADARAVFETTHSPPLLRLRDEPVRLVYDVHCAVEGVEDPEEGCAVEGTLHIRTAGDAAFRLLPLEPGSSAGTQQLVVTVPADVAASKNGFEYYAELTSADAGEREVVPGGAADAPQRSLPLSAPTLVDLGTHAFGSAALGVRVAAAPWGDGPTSVGLEPGRTLPPVGASAFDVGPDGSVFLLDQAHGRAMRWPENGDRPSPVALAVDRRLADMTVDSDGSIYVLESVARPGRTPLVRHFDGAGRSLGAVETADSAPAQLRLGPDGPVVLEQRSHQWMPIAAAGVPSSPQDQRRKARTGRPLRTGGEAVVLRRANEILAAVVVNGRVRDSWKVTSATPLAEVQLAETVGRRLVLVVRAYTETEAEFVVLALDRHGIVSRFSTPTDEWAEAAPLGRFRIAGSRLYRLGSGPGGAFVDRYDLGGQS